VTDAPLVGKRLALIESSVHELRTLARPEALKHDPKEERFVEHTLQIAIQGALDVALHIVADERLGEPETNRDLFRLLARAGWLEPSFAERLERMAGFRNILVHGYLVVDLDIVRDVVENHLQDLLDFAAAIRRRLESS
jgi:uncharacterized protein YutE (UPF0331/DUF86 family)